MNTQVLSRHTIEFFNERVASSKAMALITVVATEGSTYSKTGVQMLIDSDGESLGIVSGGCLESDLVERAKSVIEGNVAELIEYDLRADDELFGLGVGCEGLIRILIQALLPEHDYQPFRMLSDLSARSDVAKVELVIDSAQENVSAGDVRITRHGKVTSWQCSVEEFATAAQRASTGIVAFNVVPPRQLLILGAGRDAEPVAQMALLQGWNTVIVDHRPAYIEQMNVACETHCIVANEMARQIDLDRFDAVIVMSHHLQTDKAYLAALAQRGPDFVGLLGPPHRRDRILNELGAAAASLQERLHAPVGLQLGGQGPAAIALEITAQLQQYFSTLR